MKSVQTQNVATITYPVVGLLGPAVNAALIWSGFLVYLWHEHLHPPFHQGLKIDCLFDKMLQRSRSGLCDPTTKRLDC